MQCICVVSGSATPVLTALPWLPPAQDAPETLERFLASEQDLSARRNAFVMLAQHATDRAVRYLYEHVDQVTGWGDILQMAVLELLRKVCAKSPAEKGRHMKVILTLLQSQYAAVVYECACTLTALSQAPTAVRAAAGCLCQLLVSQSDNNVKLIILDRLSELKERHREVLQVRTGTGQHAGRIVAHCRLLPHRYNLDRLTHTLLPTSCEWAQAIL